MQIAIDRRRIHGRRSRPAAPGDGDLPARAARSSLFRTSWSDGMVARGYDRDFAQRCFDQIEGFGDYGFPESHAASFAHACLCLGLDQVPLSRGLRLRAAQLQPMGFYAPAQIVRDAREHGVEVLEVDVNWSEWDCTLESVEWDANAVRPERSRAVRTNESGRSALRLGLRQIDGLHREAADRLVTPRNSRPYTSVEDLRTRGCVPVHAIQRLAAADAFRSIGLDRRAALWDSRALKQAPDLPLFAYAEAHDEGSEAEPARLPVMPLCEHVVNDYQTIRLSLKAHPMRFLREHYAAQKFITADQLKTIRDGKHLSVAGLVLIRQRPGSAKGVVFITIEDETGIARSRRLAGRVRQATQDRHGRTADSRARHRPAGSG